MLLANPVQVFPSMPTLKHGHAQKRPTPLLTLGVEVYTQAKNLTIFCSMLWAGANSQKCGVTWDKMWKFTTYENVTNDPHFLNASVAEQNLYLCHACLQIFQTLHFPLPVISIAHPCYKWDDGSLPGLAEDKTTH